MAGLWQPTTQLIGRWFWWRQNYNFCTRLSFHSVDVFDLQTWYSGAEFYTEFGEIGAKRIGGNWRNRRNFWEEVTTRSQKIQENLKKSTTRAFARTRAKNYYA